MLSSIEGQDRSLKDCVSILVISYQICLTLEEFLIDLPVRICHKVKLQGTRHGLCPKDVWGQSTFIEFGNLINIVA